MSKLMDIFGAIVSASKEAGAELPAFQSLASEVKVLFTPADQATLQGHIDEARKRSDTAHDDLQAAGRGD